MGHRVAKYLRLKRKVGSLVKGFVYGTYTSLTPLKQPSLFHRRTRAS